MQRYGIVIHAGAGAAWPDDVPRAAEDGAAAAARAGFEILARGGSALDAVEVAVVALEDDPQFNAGKGSCLTAAGEVECDASVMDAVGPRAGAVAAVRTVKNPVRLAREVMEATPHVLLAGPGAEAFAAAQGFVAIDNRALVTPRALARWKKGPPQRPSGGTVGAVACDAQGRLAAATSTGGTPFKLPGRVGDTPIIGAGTWAQAGAAAVSCTGKGEPIILTALGRFAAEEVARGALPAEACRRAVARLREAGGEGGVILIAADGTYGLHFSTERMPWAAQTSDGPLRTGFFADRRETNPTSAA